MHLVQLVRLEPDERIGNYRVERELGQTSTGALYQVVHVVLPRRAVLKITTLPPFAVQLLREACILEALRHDGVPQVFESGRLADRRPWFAAEKIDGVALVERIVQGPLDPLEVAVLVRDLAEILEHAHRRGIVHRGLRPDRIVITPRRRFPLSIPDWSDAQTHDAAQSIPHVPTPGSRYYVAPELIRGDTVDDRADVYALGVIAFLALTGKHPHSSPLQLAPPVPALAMRPDAPPALARWIDQMLAPDRYDRPTSAEVHRAFADHALVLADAEPPVEDVVLVDTDGVPEAPLPRIRRPRWTPAYTLVTPALDHAIVSGEIGKPRRS